MIDRRYAAYSIVLYAIALCSCSAGRNPKLSRFWIIGLISPAIVSESIFVSAPNVPSEGLVEYQIDGKTVDIERRPPFWLGGEMAGTPKGFDTNELARGNHTLAGILHLGEASTTSNVIEFRVIQSVNRRFSPALTAYRYHPTVQLGLEELTRRTTTVKAGLPTAERQTRLDVMGMLLNWGIDPSLDSSTFESEHLLDIAPQRWASPAISEDISRTSRLLSPDSPFYQEIPSVWPRVALPHAYVKTVQLSTPQQGDGIGIGISDANSPGQASHIVSQWLSGPMTRHDYWFITSSSWTAHLPWQSRGDQRMIFVDTGKQTFLSTYKTSMSPDGSIRALAAGGVTPFDTLGDRGGTIPAHFSELGILIRQGELTDPKRGLSHAIGGPVHRAWMARVYPASGWNYGIADAPDSCLGHGFMNTGLVPYGGVIQLDPGLNLTTLRLSLPAYRILAAMQRYGYYVTGYGCADLDVLTSISEDDLKPFGGLWGYNKNGAGVQREIQAILSHANLYVAAPLYKKE